MRRVPVDLLRTKLLLYEGLKLQYCKGAAIFLQPVADGRRNSRLANFGSDPRRVQHMSGPNLMNVIDISLGFYMQLVKTPITVRTKFYGMLAIC